MTDVTLPEWSEAIVAAELPGDSRTRETVAFLARRGMLDVEELKRGLRVRSRSYVGRVQLGDLRVTIRPKLGGMPLLALLRYAFRISDLHERTRTVFADAETPFEDLLVALYLAEVEALVRRGLVRRYRPAVESLPSPRGKIRFETLAKGGAPRSSLECEHHLRRLEWSANRILLAGLIAATHVARDRGLRSQAHRLAATLADEVRAIRPDRHAFAARRRERDRTTRSYDPAVELCRLLIARRGLDPAAAGCQAAASGFLFDMNRFFQRLMGRFLSDFAEGYDVVEELGLRRMLRYAEKQNPRKARAPTPRPDFAVKQGDRTIVYLDAKYRDLWETKLPREMLYQLAMYALSRPGPGTAAILYPTLDPSARPAQLEVVDPSRESILGRVRQHPVPLLKLAEIVGVEQSERHADAASFWRELAGIEANSDRRWTVGA